MSAIWLVYPSNLAIFLADKPKANNSYHQLQRAITHPNGGKFKGTTEYDIAIESDCSRLIANAIIFYNALMLSKLLIRLEALGKHEEVALVKRLSPVAWRHINLFGRYEFYGERRMLDIDEMINAIRFDFGIDELD